MSKETETLIEHDTSITAAKFEDLKAACRYAFRAVADSIPCCIPCAVVSYDRAKKKAVVQEIVKKPYPKDGEIKYAVGVQMAVRVLSPTVGGFAIDFPLFVGDKGWVIVSDVDTSILMKSGSPTAKVLSDSVDVTDVTDTLPVSPASTITHIPDSGFFVPDCWAGFDVSKIKNAEGEVSSEDIYIGASDPNTYKEDENGKKQEVQPVDSLSSITITRGKEDGRVLISVGSKAGISVRGSEIKLMLNPGGEDGGEPLATITMNADSKEISIKATKVKVESESCELPENTTVGGKHFSEQAFQG